MIGTPIYGDDSEKAPSSNAPFSHVRHFRRDAIAPFLQAESPNVVVLQHWGLASELPELSVPLAIDLAGPHLLERLYWGSADPDRDITEKLAALRRADFLVCSGEFQKHYFYPFMEIAGFDLRQDSLPVIPFSAPPPGWEEKAYGRKILPPSTTEGITFVYGGAFLAWQDPEKPLTWLLDELDKAGNGRLLFYGGPHPVADASAGKFTMLTERLSNHLRVEMRGFKPFEELLPEYRACTVALDLMSQNPERELAFTTRTMIYLYCGLPVIYNDYSELSAIVRAQGCGWSLNPNNEMSFRETIRSILDGSAPIERMRTNALAAADIYSWEKTITPLADFCAAPFFREGKTAKLLAVEAQAHEFQKLQRERDNAVRELAIVQGKFINRLARRFPALGILLAPFGYIAGWIAAFYLWLKFRPTCVDGSRPPK